jgi:hypothetical protein
VSFTVVDTETAAAVIVRVSEPSVKVSFNKVTETEAAPLELTTRFPVNEPPAISALLKPDKVYGMDVPEVTLAVVKVKVTANPSSIDALLAARA